jgi:hypothetical protein
VHDQTLSDMSDLFTDDLSQYPSSVIDILAASHAPIDRLQIDDCASFITLFDKVCLVFVSYSDIVRNFHGLIRASPIS